MTGNGLGDLGPQAPPSKASGNIQPGGGGTQYRQALTMQQQQAPPPKPHSRADPVLHSTWLTQSLTFFHIKAERLG